MNKAFLIAIVSLAGLSASLALQQTTPPAATAILRDLGGRDVGRVTFTTVATGVKMTVSVRGFQAAARGAHGIHLHAVGSCSPDFKAAGGHFNPAGHAHGLLSTKGAHAGDLPNIAITSFGTAAYEVITNRVTLEDGPTSLFDSDGTAVVIHAGPDDLHTDPTGQSGDRIACGVVTRV